MFATYPAPRIAKFVTLLVPNRLAYRLLRVDSPAPHVREVPKANTRRSDDGDSTTLRFLNHRPCKDAVHSLTSTAPRMKSPAKTRGTWWAFSMLLGVECCFAASLCDDSVASVIFVACAQTPGVESPSDKSEYVGENASKLKTLLVLPVQ